LKHLNDIIEQNNQMKETYNHFNLKNTKFLQNKIDESIKESSHAIYNKKDERDKNIEFEDSS
jgi:hypothetical protein